jgi:hypothetical protein
VIRNIGVSTEAWDGSQGRRWCLGRGDPAEGRLVAAWVTAAFPAVDGRDPGRAGARVGGPATDLDPSADGWPSPRPAPRRPPVARSPPTGGVIKKGTSERAIRGKCQTPSGSCHVLPLRRGGAHRGLSKGDRSRPAIRATSPSALDDGRFQWRRRPRGNDHRSRCRS